MARVDQERRKSLERILTVPLPEPYVAFLKEHKPIQEGGYAARVGRRDWDIRNTFTLDTGDGVDQLDKVYGLVGDVLPPGALPFAEDWAGNFYCLMLSGRRKGQVVYWDHERDPDDHHVEPITKTFEEFISKIVAVDDDDDDDDV